MRQVAESGRIRGLLAELGRAARSPGRVYLVGGATAVLLGWRPATIDIDLKLDPESDELLRAIARLKDEVQVNVELASPPDFIPELPGWRERSIAVEQFGPLAVFHYDMYSQALAKIERGHRQDLEDVRSMLQSGLVNAPRLIELFGQIEENLFRYPAIDAGEFRRAVLRAAEGA